MKKLFISMLAIAALASCAKEETLVADQGELIGFNSFVENSTRATDPSYGAADNAQDLTAFKVWGTVAADASSTPVAIFADDTVTGTAVGENSTWTCTTKTQYWLNGALYNFAALANAGTVTLGADLLPASVEFTSNGSTDLIYAKSKTYTGKPAGQNEKVAFNFAHLLSKVHVKVTNLSTAATNYSFLVKNININAPKTGTYYIQTVGANTAETWTATKGDYTFANLSVAGGAAGAECAAEQLLIPGAATITFDVDILVGGETMSTANYSYTTTLAAANAYSFNIKVSVGDPIQFTVEQNPTWTEKPAVDIN